MKSYAMKLRLQPTCMSAHEVASHVMLRTAMLAVANDCLSAPT